MAGPLAGLRVVEFAGMGPGPFCAMMLADHGADVVRIDRIGAAGAAEPAHRDMWNRSRKGIALDLKSTRGIALARRICTSADAIVEGFRPGVMERLGLGPEVLLSDNPKLVYGRMTGWGQEGPYASMAGHDINYIALSGVLHAMGRKGERPVPPLNLVGDMGGGGMMLAFGIVAALLNAQNTGKGEIVDCAMTEGSATLMIMMYSLLAQGRWRDERGVNLLDSAAPFYDTYETADNKYMAVGAIEPQFYRRFIEILGLSEDPEFSRQNDQSLWQAQKNKVIARFRTRTRQQWTDAFAGEDACVAPVMSMTEAANHPHNRARGAFIDVGGARQPVPAPRYSFAGTSPPAPLSCGEGVTHAILEQAGLSASEIDDLRRSGVVD